MNTENLIVQVCKLYKSYNSKEVLKGINFSVSRGEIFVLLGPNGAGKTTTLKIIAGVIEADDGDVVIFGSKMSSNNLFVKQNIGYLPDEPYVYNKLLGKEFIEFIMSVYNKKIEQDKYKFFVSQLELEEYINQPIEVYSKGMKQKLLLMSIFLREPELYILDEPLVGLDPKSISFFKQYIIELAKNGKTVIVSTHLLDLAEQIATKIAIIYNGKILICGNKKEVATQLATSDKLEEIYLKVISQQNI